MAYIHTCATDCQYEQTATALQRFSDKLANQPVDGEPDTWVDK